MKTSHSEGGTRTHDPVVNSHLLYRLSYLGSTRNLYSIADKTMGLQSYNRSLPRVGLEPTHRTALGSKPSMSTNSITPAQIHCFLSHKIQVKYTCGGWNRTTCLRVMSPARYHFSTPHLQTITEPIQTKSRLSGGRSRTYNRLIQSQVLYQLSYSRPYKDTKTTRKRLVRHWGTRTRT